MSRSARREQKLLQEQNTVAMQRAERREQEELAGRKKIAATLTPEERLSAAREKHTPPLRVPRAGKPLKRAR